jgi:hypothetical protein
LDDRAFIVTVSISSTAYTHGVEWLLILLVVVAMLFVWGGIKLISMARRAVKPAVPAIPPARVVGDEGERLETRGERAVDKLGRAILVSIGLALIAIPWIAAYLVYRLSSDAFFELKLGRTLRVRNRAWLPEIARGDGWSGDRVTMRGILTTHERQVVGAYWLLAARTEHASVAAFSQLGLQLTALGAPARLLEATHRAALDEIRHAQVSFAIARAISGEQHTAGPIPALATRSGAIDLTGLAIETLIDGCVGEGIAADVAARSSCLADEPAVRDALATIALDEARHAELAWDILAWALAEGDGLVRRAVRDHLDRLSGQRLARLPSIPGIDNPAHAHLGVIDQTTLDELSRVRLSAVEARGRRLLAAVEPVVASAA